MAETDTSDRRTTRGSQLGRVATVLTCIAAVGTGAAPWVNFKIPGLPVVQSLSPAIALIGLVVVAIVWWWQRNMALWVAAGLCFLTASLPLAYGVFDATKATQCESHCFTTVSFNVRFGGADTGKFVHNVERLNADVVLVQEITPEFASRLRAETVRKRPFADVFRHSAGFAKSGPSGTVLYSKHPIDSPEQWLVDAGLGEPHVSPAVTISTPHGQVTVANIHTAPPLPGMTRQWRDDLRQIRSKIEQTNGPLIVAGDFNADVTHPDFRKLRSGMIDAIAGSRFTAGAFPQNTWPDKLPAPFTRLDHILVRDASPSAGGVLCGYGSDHRAVWATVSLPGEAA